MVLPGMLEVFSGLRPCGGADLEAFRQLSVPDVSARTDTAGGLSGAWGSPGACTVGRTKIEIYDNV